MSHGGQYVPLPVSRFGLRVFSLLCSCILTIDIEKEMVVSERVSESQSVNVDGSVSKITHTGVGYIRDSG